MTTDTSKITTAADDLGDKLTKGGGAAKTLGAEIANAIKSLDARVVALESGSVTPPDPIPPDPVPPDYSTVGRVENFSAIGGTVPMKIGGQATKNLNANNANVSKPWVLRLIDDYSLKYEVRSGDQAGAGGGGWVDSPGCERSETELMPRYGAGVTINIEYGFMLHSDNPPNTSQWMIIGQCHFDKGSGSPPCAIAMKGEKMQIVLRGPNNQENVVYTDSAAIQRGHKYKMKLQVKFNGNGTGSCQVWRDDTRIVNYSGALGSGVSGDTHYWKQGIYRNQAPETLAATYSNTSVTSS